VPVQGRVAGWRALLSNLILTHIVFVVVDSHAERSGGFPGRAR
jgi:hypothetical protein